MGFGKSNLTYLNLCIFLKYFHLFIFRGEGKEEERERNINVWLPLVCPTLGTWPATQACALNGNQTSNLSVHRLALNPLSHTSQGCCIFTKCFLSLIWIIINHYLFESPPHVFCSLLLKFLYFLFPSYSTLHCGLFPQNFPEHLKKVKICCLMYPLSV